MGSLRLATLVTGALLGGVTVAQNSVPPPPVTVQDCTKLKGRARKDCMAAPAPVTGAKPAGTADDKFAFPEDASKNGGELEERAGGQTPKNTGDMPTTGVPDPPADSLKPIGRAPAGSSSSSSSSSSSGNDAVPDDEDAAPTTAGSDTPVKASDLKSLGAKVDSTQARAKLEESRVEDDLKIGRFYYKDGNFAGATARYQDAIQHDPENPDAHFGLAEVLLKQNKRTEAAAELKRYLELAPDDDHTRDAQKMLAKLR